MAIFNLTENLNKNIIHIIYKWQYFEKCGKFVLLDINYEWIFMK